MYSERGTFCSIIYIVADTRAPCAGGGRRKRGSILGMKGKVDRKRWMVTLIGFGSFVFGEFLWHIVCNWKFFGAAKVPTHLYGGW